MSASAENSKADSSAAHSMHRGPRHAARRRRHLRGVRWQSKARFFGFPLCEVALGPNAAHGQRIGHARAVIAIGNIADGVIAVGGISRGIVAIGGVSLGVASVGGVSMGLAAALGGVAIAPLALGGVAIGVLARGGAGWDMHGRLHHLGLMNGYLSTVMTSLRPGA